MGDTLGKLVKHKRVLEQKVTNNTKTSIINVMNKYSKDFGFDKLPKTATTKQVNHAKKIYDTRLAYDIVTKAINEGNTVVASTYNVDLKKSDDKSDQRIAKYAPQLAQVKKLNDMKLTKEEKVIVGDGNQHIKGYGVEDMTSMVESLKTDKQFEKLISEMKVQNPKQMYYDKQIDTFERVFQKIEGVREDDLTNLKEHLKGLDITGITNATNMLFQSLDMYGSDQSHVGKYDVEQELKKARLDDIMIKLGLKASGQRKVASTLKKYKTESAT